MSDIQGRHTEPPIEGTRKEADVSAGRFIQYVVFHHERYPGQYWLRCVPIVGGGTAPRSQWPPIIDTLAKVRSLIPSGYERQPPVKGNATLGIVEVWS